MSTVGEVINEFCDRILQPRESAIVGSSKPAARQYLSLFNFIGKQLVANPNGWTQLKRIYTFTTSTGVSNYQLPGDFDKLLTGTQWSVTNQRPLSGPISNEQMAAQTYGANSSTGSYQVTGAQGYIYNTTTYTQRSSGYFQISPAGVNGTNQNAIAYLSRNFVWPRDWVAFTPYTVGDVRTGVNNMYVCLIAGTSSNVRPSFTSGILGDGTVTWGIYTEPYTISSDADFCLLDDELMVEGMRWAWYRAKRQSYDQERKDWDVLIKSALGRQNGASTVNAGDNNLSDWPNVPFQNWNI